MSINIGGIDIANTLINNELRIAVAEKLLERLLLYAPQGAISQADIDRFRQEALQELQRKYPEAGISADPPTAN